MLNEELSKLDTFADVLNFRNAHGLKTFVEMWYHMFLWCLVSSVFVHTCAALIAFVTLRKHKFGRFHSILILVMGVVSPATSGVMSSGMIAFVHRVSSLQMLPGYALVWGIGLTIVSAFVGYLRILATLWFRPWTKNAISSESKQISDETKAMNVPINQNQAICCIEMIAIDGLMTLSDYEI